MRIGMTKLTEELSVALGVSQAQAREAIYKFVSIATAYARTGKTVVIPGLGTLKLTKRLPKHFNLGDKRTIPARWRLFLIPSAENRGEL